MGKDARAAVRAAVRWDDVARTVRVSRLSGDPAPIAQSDTGRRYDRYQNIHGQTGPSIP